MKKIFLALILIIFTACTSISKNIWGSSEILNVVNLQTGDIIIKEKEFNLFGIYGHSGIMRDGNILVDYPQYGSGINIFEIQDWIEKNRKIIVLRYIGMNEVFRQKLAEKIDYYIKSNKKYGISLNKNTDKKFYCSQFIWYLYYKTAKELGFQLDIDSDRGFLVFPYDFINSKELKIVNSENI